MILHRILDYTEKDAILLERHSITFVDFLHKYVDSRLITVIPLPKRIQAMFTIDSIHLFQNCAWILSGKHATSTIK
jgi:hypothetical protein